MQTKEILVNGKTFQAHEFLLEDYPDCMQAFDDLRSKDRKLMPPAFRAILAKSSNVPDADARACTWREMMLAVPAIMEVNGLKAAPKAQAEEPEMTVTASEPPPEPSAS